MKSNRYRMFTASVVLALSVVLYCSSLLFASNIQFSKDGNWLKETQNNGKIGINHCGIDVVLYTLKYYGVEYKIPLISAELPITDQGVDLLSIKHVLDAMGLTTEARRVKSTNEISQSLHQNCIGIVALNMGTMNHYCIVQNNQRNESVLVDVSRGIIPLVQEKNDARIRDAGSIVLFVTPPQKKRELCSDLIHLSAREIDLGDILTNGTNNSQPVFVSFSLKNTSSFPIMVENIGSSCGCIYIKWKGGMIKPGNKVDVGINVNPGAWGEGEISRQIIVKYFDGSITKIVLKGTGITLSERQRIELSQYSAIIEIIDESDSDSFDFRLARLSSYVRPLNEVKLTSDVSWMTPTLKEQETNEGKGTAELYAKISIKDLLPFFENGEDRIYGKLYISGNEGIEPVEMKVEVFQRNFYRLNQYLVSLTPNTQEHAVIQVTSESENDEINIVDAESEVDFIIVDSGKSDGVSSITIKFDTTKEMKPGYYSINAKLENSKGKKALAKMTINVTP